MKAILLSILTLNLLMLIPACEDVGTSSERAGFITYKYTAFDTLGHALVRGTLWLQFDSANVTGTWKFEDNRSGELEGWLSNDTLSLNLNPRFVDNNLFLFGILTATTYTGKWEQIGFPGVMTEGTFSASKNLSMMR